jgi:hypothetical protein
VFYTLIAAVVAGVCALLLDFCSFLLLYSQSGVCFEGFVVVFCCFLLEWSGFVGCVYFVSKRADS